MKKFRKLIPALCMLLISAMLMGTSTYAWFSMNTTVTATGMSVTADAPQSLLISTTNATTGFGSSVTLASDTSVASEIVPSTYTNSGATYTFFKLTDLAMKSVNESGALTGTAASAPVAENDYYTATTVDYYKDSVWLKLEGSAGTKQLKLSVAFTSDPSQLAKTAMHVLIVNSTSGVVVKDYDMSGAGTAENLVVLTSGAAATQFDIYYFLDGTDDECKNTNLTADASMSVTLTFSIHDVA